MLGKILLFLGGGGLATFLVLTLFTVDSALEGFVFAGVCISLLLLLLAGVIIPPKARLSNVDLSLPKDNRTANSESKD